MGFLNATIGLSLAVTALAAYLAGRVHQWCRNGDERRRAYCRGYDEASHSLFRRANADRPGAAALPPPR